MDLLKNLKLAHRFAILIGIVFGGFTVYGVWSFKTLDELKVNGLIYQRIIQGKDLVADILPPPEYIIESYLVSLQMFNGDRQQQFELQSRLKQLKIEFDQRHGYWLQQDLSAELQDQFLNQAYKAAINFYDLAFGEFLTALNADDRVQAAEILQRMHDFYELHRKAVDQVVILANQRVRSDEKFAREKISSATIMMLAVLLLTMIITVFMALLISSSVTTPLFALKKAIKDINERNDFTLRLNLDTPDEIGQTAKAFDGLIRNLQSTLGSLLNNANDLTSAAQSLSVSAQQVAVSSKNQSAEAQSIVRHIEKVNTSARDVTNGAQSALVLSRQSGDLSNEGGNIIQNAAETIIAIAETIQRTAASIMTLGKQSDQISSIVQVIKDVADQTNLLALNAAIEAARAGEQGRGFAVVADEVRNLAKRTTKATEEISDMIEAIQSSTAKAIDVMGDAVIQADHGAVIAAQAGKAIDQIKVGSSQVVKVVNEISKSLLSQNNASDSIGLHVEQVARMTEENKSAAESSAMAAIKLEKLAEGIRETIKRFHL